MLNYELKISDISLILMKFKNPSYRICTQIGRQKWTQTIFREYKVGQFCEDRKFT